MTCKHKWHKAGKAEPTPLGIYLILYCEKCGRYKEAVEIKEKHSGGKR